MGASQIEVGLLQNDGTGQGKMVFMVQRKLWQEAVAPL